MAVVLWMEQPLCRNSSGILFGLRSLSFPLVWVRNPLIAEAGIRRWDPHASWFFAFWVCIALFVHLGMLLTDVLLFRMRYLRREQCESKGIGSKRDFSQKRYSGHISGEYPPSCLQTPENSPKIPDCSEQVSEFQGGGRRTSGRLPGLAVRLVPAPTNENLRPVRRHCNALAGPATADEGQAIQFFLSFRSFSSSTTPLRFWRFSFLRRIVSTGSTTWTSIPGSRPNE